VTPEHSNPIVHLELHTGDLPGAQDLYGRLLGWQAERIECPRGSYTALELSPEIGGGIVECGTRHSLWLPYVEVLAVRRATERARALGAAVLLEPREGPAGWRSVVAAPAGGQIAFWQPKR
jgi:predicted enzyme related to lactoylglutathione lyase